MLTVAVTLYQFWAGYIVSRRIEFRQLRQKTISTAMQNELIRLQSFTDPLTEIYNRRSLEELAGRFIGQARRMGTPLTFLLIDLDRFKQVNTRFGHLTGDFVLTEIATLLKGSIRGTDAAIRYGGDEFCAVLPDLGESDACLIAERLRAAVAELCVWHEQVLVHTSASIGVAGCDRVTDETMAGLVHAADAALYRAKRTGGDRVALASEGSGLDEARDGRAGPSVLSG